MRESHYTTEYLQGLTTSVQRCSPDSLPVAWLRHRYRCLHTTGTSAYCVGELLFKCMGVRTCKHRQTHTRKHRFRVLRVSGVWGVGALGLGSRIRVLLGLG